MMAETLFTPSSNNNLLSSHINPNKGITPTLVSYSISKLTYTSNSTATTTSIINKTLRNN
jgi:hypothetical protein